MVAVWLILITDIENFGRWKCSVTAVLVDLTLF